MKSAAACIDKPVPRQTSSGFLSDYARRVVLNRLQALRHGELVLIEGTRCHRFGRRDAVFSRSVTLEVTDPGFYRRVLLTGSLGAGEAWIEGEWQCDRLTTLIELFLCNCDHLEKLDGGVRSLVAPLQLLQRFVKRNSLRGSRRNIEAHYDLGNDLFKLFLDPTMMYSCGIFHHKESTLQEASEAKLERICRKLQLEPGDRVLEIGTGWGGFAIHAAQHYGCQVTTTTISREQYEYACARVREAGLENCITLLFDDYRELDGQYDKLVSIEMIEAVGHRNFARYFNQCSRLLKSDGMMLLQAITISDQRYPAAKKAVDFIQRYIFPGGALPCVAALGDAVARNTDMRIFHLEDIGPHYATTLQHWRKRLFANIAKVRRLGYPERFIRMWEYYLSYCEGGFRQQAIGTVQLLLVKPRCLRAPLSSTDC